MCAIEHATAQRDLLLSPSGRARRQNTCEGRAAITRVHLVHSGAYEPRGKLGGPVVVVKRRGSEESLPHMIYLLRPIRESWVSPELKLYANAGGEVINT